MAKTGKTKSSNNYLVRIELDFVAAVFNHNADDADDNDDEEVRMKNVEMMNNYREYEDTDEAADSDVQMMMN